MISRPTIYNLKPLHLWPLTVPLSPGSHNEHFQNQSKDEFFRTVAINPSKSQCTISAERVADGRGFKLPAANIAMYLQCSRH